MKTPVIVSFTATGTPVSDIPFPAITICSETKTRKEVFNFGAFFEDLNKSETFEDEKKYDLFMTSFKDIMVSHRNSQIILFQLLG